MGRPLVLFNARQNLRTHRQLCVAPPSECERRSREPNPRPGAQQPYAGRAKPLQRARYKARGRRGLYFFYLGKRNYSRRAQRRREVVADDRARNSRGIKVQCDSEARTHISTVSQLSQPDKTESNRCTRYERRGKEPVCKHPLRLHKLAPSMHGTNSIARGLLSRFHCMRTGSGRRTHTHKHARNGAVNNRVMAERGTGEETSAPCSNTVVFAVARLSFAGNAAARSRARGTEHSVDDDDEHGALPLLYWRSACTHTTAL